MSGNCDIRYMQIALSIAARGIGLTAPNPSVGCVIVKNDVIVGRGWTAAGGRPHAETQALKSAAELAKGATAYITLEPCCHQGETSPCTDALIRAGIYRVVIATGDLHPKVSGKGIAALKKADIEITEGICEEEAKQLNAGFFSVVSKNRPLVTLKLATTLDGKIATSYGESQWITCEKARRFAHLLRYRNDAVMVGVGTVLADNPSLTCRLPGLEKYSPIPIIMDSNLRTPPDSKIAENGWIVTWSVKDRGRKTKNCHPEHSNVSCEVEGSQRILYSATSDSVQNDLAKQTVLNTLFVKPSSDGRIDLQATLEEIAKRGVTRLLVEGGAALAASFLKAGLVDKLVWFHAPAVLGNTGISAIGDLGINQLAEMLQFTHIASQKIGETMVSFYED